MEGRDGPPPQQHAQQQPPPMMHQNSFHPGNHSALMGLNSGSMIPQTARFPFNTLLQPPQPQAPTMNVVDGGGGTNGGGFEGSQQLHNSEPAKKKRGRPRKYTPEGNIALGLTPNPTVAAVTPARPVDSSGGGGNGNGKSDQPAKRNRGRPPGSGKKQMDALGGGGVGFTPHVLIVQAGEDIAAKLAAFTMQGRTICILSANGSISNVLLKQPALGGRTVRYEGQFELLSLSASLLLSDEQGSPSRCGSLTVSMAASDSLVLGGVVVGVLTAASPVQIIVGSFIADGKKNSSASKSAPPSASGSHMLHFSTPVTTASPPSGASSDSSDDNDTSPPLNHGPSGMFHNHVQLPQPMPNMHMYHHQLWATQTPQ